MALSRGDKSTIKFTAFFVGLCALLGAAFVGPAGCSRQFQSWYARSYGSDWLVAQYAQDGYLIAEWELHAKSIGSESGSDGIYFTDDDGNVVHLSGHYVYVQIVGGKWEPARARFVLGRERAAGPK